MFTLATCAQLNLDNGGVTYNESMVMTDEYPVDTLASFSCDRGYNLNGSATSTCQTSGEWDQDTPTCEQGNEMGRLY